MESLSLLEAARKIAVEALQSNTVTLFNEPSHIEFDRATSPRSRRYLLAGSRQYKALWARDFAFASLGAIHCGFSEVIYDSLDTLFEMQREDGLLPRGIDRHNIYRRVLTGLFGGKLDWGRPLYAWYVTENGVICLDSNLLLPWAAGEYLRHTGDVKAARRWLPAVEKAIAFVEKNFVVEGLVSNQAPFSDWADSIARTGKVAITNIFYILALRSLRDWSKLLGDDARFELYSSKEKHTTEKFRHTFWCSQKKFVQNFEGDVHLSADANLFAVAFKILPEKECSEILAELKKTPLWEPMPGRPTWPEYPSSLKSRTVRWINLKDYHDRLYWMWISSLAAYAEAVIGNKQSYHEIIERISGQFKSDGAVHEIYDLCQGKLKPLVRTFYRAEAPFSWSAGMFIWALSAGTK